MKTKEDIYNDFSFAKNTAMSFNRGWDSLVYKFCVEANQILERNPEFIASFMIVDIKEKYGTLRIYCYGGNDEMWDLIIKYEELSESICEECGDVGELRDYGWLKTMCDDCYTKLLSERDF